MGTTVVHAQDDEDVAVDTGALLLQAKREREERDGRINEFRQLYLQDRARIAEHQPSLVDLAARRRTHRLDCHTRFLNASPDSKFSIAIECYRTGLVLDKDALQRRRLFIEGLPYLSDHIRATSLQIFDELIDAFNTIIEGIDANVFQSIREIQETKQNLRSFYRSPLWQALIRARAERLLVWGPHLIDRLENAKGTVEVPEVLETAQRCLADAGDKAREALDATEEDARTLLQEAYVAHQECIAALRAGEVQEMPEEEPEGEPEEEPVTDEEPAAQTLEIPEDCLTVRTARCLRRWIRFQSDIEFIETE